MWVNLFLAVALCLVGNSMVSSDGAMGRLHWCNTLCMCDELTQDEVQCFGRNDIYELLEVQRIQVLKLQRVNWELENQVSWCNNTCLCLQGGDQRLFKCAEEDNLKQFIVDNIGDQYFYTDKENSEERLRIEEEEARKAMAQQKRMEERRKNRKNRKPRKRVKPKKERPQEVTTEPNTTTYPLTTTTTYTTTSTIPTTTEIVMTTTPVPEVVFVKTEEQGGEYHYTPPATPLILTSGGPTQISQLTPTERSHAFPMTYHTPYEPYSEPMAKEDEEAEEEDAEHYSLDDEDEQRQQEEEQHQEDEEEEEEEEEYHLDEEEEDAEEIIEPLQYPDEEEEEEDYVDAEPLPKQEAVAASPAVTAMQPPTRRQPFPPTASPHSATREGETPPPKVSPIMEVPVQRKTVASEVSQDLDELGNAIMQIKGDVVLNQRILLVTVAVAGIAMLGVLVLAIHGCLASKRQAAAEERQRLRESPKEDNHVTKVNLEEAW